MRKRLATVHGIAAVTAFTIILAFMAGSVATELAGSEAAIAGAKAAIGWGLLALVPALAVTGATGYRLVAGNPRGVAATKFRRMRIVAANGMLVLVPSALFLAWKAGHGAFDTWFVAVQAVEYAAGAANLSLMGLNMRDGFRMRGRLRHGPARPAGGKLSTAEGGPASHRGE